MFRKIALAAALALTASIGIAHAEGEYVGGQATQEQLRESAAFRPTMSGVGARALGFNSEANQVVVYDSAQTRNLATGGTPILVSEDGGNFRTVYTN